MSEPIGPELPAGFSLEQLRTQAKELKRAVRAADPSAIARMARSHPKYAGRPPDRLVPERVGLRDAQATLAREMGFAGWRDLILAAERAAGGPAPSRWPAAAHHALVRRSFEQAKEVGIGVCGPEEILLALLDPPRPTAASAVLGEAGLTHAGVLEAARRRGAVNRPPQEAGVVSNPAWSESMGMARGLALSAGSARVTDEHALLALLYLGCLDHFLEQLDLTPAEFLARLVAAGVDVPPLLPEEPAGPRGPMGPRVYFPCDEKDVGPGLLKTIRGRAWYGFNVDERGRCYVDGEEDADLPALVRSLVSDPERVQVVPWEEVERARSEKSIGER